MLLVQATTAAHFQADKLVRIREESAGVRLLPHYIGEAMSGHRSICIIPSIYDLHGVGKVLGLATDLCFFSAAFNAGYYPFIQTRVSFLRYWSGTACTYDAA